MTLTNSSVTGNVANNGGGAGVFNFGGSKLVIVSSTVSGNNAANGAVGGGVQNNGVATFTYSTVNNNTAANIGGGIYNSGTLTAISVTVAGNVSSVNGGGVINSGNLTLINNTISGNTASSGGGGVFNDPAGTANLKNSIVANNTISSGSGPDLSGTFNSQDYNLIKTTAGAVLTGTIGHNITTQDPQLATLASNGGPTQTLALLPGSPAIDAADNCVVNNSCSPALASVLTTDQRSAGFVRSADGNGDGTAIVDIGAFEVQSILVTNTNDSGAGSLRQAITDANVNGGTDAINFQAGLNGAIVLAAALPDLSTPMAINGPGAIQLAVQRSALPGVPEFRLFNIQTVTVNITGLTIANGLISGNSFPNNNGAGIFNAGMLTLKGVTISGNTVSSGNGSGAGGIYNSGTLSLVSSTISGNQSNSGAGGGVVNNGTLILSNTTITGNTVGGVFQGGALLNSSGTATITNSRFTANSAFAGGAIFNNQFATINFSAGLIDSNVTTNGGDGGAVLNNGRITFVNATLTNNHSAGSGGAILNNPVPLSFVTLINCTVSANTAVASLNAGGGAIYNAGTVNLQNTIVAGNSITNGTGPDLKGSINSLDYNLIGNTSGANFTGTTTHNILNQSANLASLSNNGGPTQTMLPLPGSSAIDAGDVANLPTDTYDLDGDGNTTELLPVDQRGLSRVVHASFDLGAVETNYGISVTAGSGQSTPIHTVFNVPLKTTVTESGNLKSGIPVLFTAPSTGASGQFPGNVLTTTVATDGSGIATAPTLTANGIAGGPYDVIASLGGSLPTAVFHLTNLKGDQVITFPLIPAKTFGDSDFTVSAVASSGLVLSFIANGQCTITGNTAHLSGAGSCTITASQPGDSNYNPAVPVPQSFTINKATATITFGNLTQDYDGTAKSVTVSTTPSGLSTTVTYSPVASPTEIETYTVSVTVNDANYEGSASQTLTIIPQLFFDFATNRLTAIDSVTFVAGPFPVNSPHNFATDQKTRIMIFSYFGAGGPDPTLTVQAGGIPLTVESVQPLSGVGGVFCIIVKLNEGLSQGDVLLTINVRGVASQPRILSIAP